MGPHHRGVEGRRTVAYSLASMTFHATVVTVLLAAPGDTNEARAAILEEVARWNGRYAKGRGFVFSPWTWDAHSTPILGDRPQSIINSQGVDKSDVVVVVFRMRLGTPTGVDISGTVEEINRAVRLGKPVHVFFYRGSVPTNEIDPAELQRLRDFKSELESRGLYGEYDSARDLASQVRDALEFDIEDMEAAPVPSPTAGARLTVRHRHEKELSGYDKQGRPKYRHAVRDLVIGNDGDRPAEGVRFHVTSLEEGFPFHLQAEVDENGWTDAFDLTPGSSRSWTCFPVRGPLDVQIELAWQEDGVAHETTYTTTIT